MNNKIRCSIITSIGFILSPLSWWNDLFINIPLAYAFALPFGMISRKFFLPAMILGYWITNVAGFMMMHQGFKDLFSKEKKEYTRKELVRDLIVSMIYTLIVVIFVLAGWLRFPTEYF